MIGRPLRRLSVPISLLVVFIQILAAQEVPPADSTARTSVKPDTTARQSGSSIDTLVTYTATDSIVYSLQTRYMDMFGKCETRYRTIALKAERVNLNWDTSTLDAFGQPDTLRKDSTIGRPILRDGGEEYHGEKVGYNFQTRKGKITVGTTEMENGYYRGEEIKKIATDEMFVKDGRFTTCDAPHPHFYFASPEMKVYVRDKIVAEPVYFYIADVPVLALPFGVFPSHAGRASGLIAPAYGDDMRFGKYFSHLGYYWAVNDYFDVATMFDYYSRGGWLNETDIHYRLRYKFDGGITAQISDRHEGETSDPTYNERRDYHVSWSHHQTLTPSSRVDVDFTFASANYFKNYSTNLNEILQQNIISNATFWKTWEKSNRSLTINVNRDQSLTTGEIREGLPSVSFTQGQIYPFRSAKKSRGLSLGEDSGGSLLETVGFSYGANFSNFRNKLKASVDSVFIPGTDSLGIRNDFSHQNSQTLTQNMSMSISPKLGRITVTPSLSFADSRQFSELDSPFRNIADSTMAFHTTKSRHTAGTLNAGISTSTRFFGMFSPRIFGITALRHTVNPGLSLFYSKQVYGENIPKYGLVGAFSIANNFEMKVQTADSVEPAKIQLLNIGGGVSYNFAADSMRFSPVNVNFRTAMGQYLSLDGNATYNLYQFDPRARSNAGARVDRLLLMEKGRIADMTSFSIRLSTTLQGQKKAPATQSGVPSSVVQEQERAQQPGGMPGQRKTVYSIYDREDADFSIPWNIGLSYQFSQNQDDPRRKIRTSSLSFTLSFNLTDKWQIASGGSYDLVTGDHFIPSVDVTRDLHCWQMRFSWFPMGYQKGYRFEIRVKAPQLQDIKLTKQGSARSYNY